MEDLEEIADFWLNCTFLEKYKELGEQYEEKLKEAKNEKL